MSGAATGPEQIAEREQAALLLPCSLARRVLSPALQESVNVHAQLLACSESLPAAAVRVDGCRAGSVRGLIQRAAS